MFNVDLRRDPADAPGRLRSRCRCVWGRAGSPGADGGSRTRTLVREADFRTTSAFAAALTGVRGLDYPFAVPRVPRFRRRPSSLYTVPTRVGLGSGSARSP